MKFSIGDQVLHQGQKAGTILALDFEDEWLPYRTEIFGWVQEKDLSLVEEKKDQALRYNVGKPELAYVDTFPAALEGVAKVSMGGRRKYEFYNYKLGAASCTESYNCARRHMVAWFNGEDMVPDSPEDLRYHHLDAAIWNLMRLRQELVDFPERDNRPHILVAKMKEGKNG
jgi:hypothetical protein